MTDNPDAAYTPPERTDMQYAARATRSSVQLAAADPISRSQGEEFEALHHRVAEAAEEEEHRLVEEASLEEITAALLQAQQEVARLQERLERKRRVSVSHDPYVNGQQAVVDHRGGVGVTPEPAEKPAAQALPMPAVTPKNGFSTKAPPASKPPPVPHRCLSIEGVTHYFRKWRGQHLGGLQVSRWRDLLLMFIAAFCGIAVPAALNFNMLPVASRPDLIFLIASFGASAVLLYGVPMADLSQPRNCIGGHTLSALVGVCVRYLIFPDDQPPSDTDEFMQREWLACGLAVAIAVVLMNLTKTTHPPGGATALQAVLVNPIIRGAGWKYVGLMGCTACVMTLIALVFNNLPRKRVWPKFWL